MALYESLTASSSASEISNAYAEFAAGAGGDTKENQDTAINFLRSRGVSEEKIGLSYELYRFQAETDAMLKADEEAFAKARAEIENLTQQEQNTIKKQTADYQAAQDRIRAQAEAEAQAAALEQARIQKEIADIKAQQEAEAAKVKAEMEGMKRTSAAKLAASKKAGRSAGARPLLGGATPETIGQKAQMLGGEASLSGQVGTLGAEQTLGA